LQRQKARKTGGVEARIILARAFIWGEQYIAQRNNGIVPEALDENKLNLVFNLINKSRRKLMGRLIHNGLEFGAQPNKRDPKAQSDAEVVDKVIKGLDRIVDQPTKTWEIIDHLIAGGVCAEYTCWAPDATVTAMPNRDEAGNLMFKDLWTGEVIPEAAREMALADGNPPERFELDEVAEMAGEVMSEIIDGLNLFIDQTVPSIDRLAPDQWVYIAKIKTRGWIEENFEEVPGVEDIEYDKELKIVTTSIGVDQVSSVASMFLRDLIPGVQGQADEDDPDMAVVVDGWCPASKKNPRGRWVTFIPDKIMLRDTPNEYPGVPLVDFHFEPTSTTFWTKDYITDQIAPQRFFNKRMSQLGEQSNATLYDLLLLGGNVKRSDVPADHPGPIEGVLDENGVPLVARLGPPEMPVWFLESIKMVLQAANEIAGGQSLTESEKFPGQLRGPSAVPLMQEILDTEWGPLYTHIANRMAMVKQHRLDRVQQYYPPLRIMHFTDSNQRDEVMEFVKDDVFSGETKFQIHVEPSSIIPEMRALREARVRERLQSPLGILYMDERTGRLDKSKIAADLRMGDSAREDRESASRKFSQQLLERLKTGQQVPPVEQFWDHGPMLDELEAEMMTTEFLSMSPPVQQLLRDRWQQHVTFLQQKAEMQQQGMQSSMIQNAVAQATQQAAATAAADAVNSAMGQMHAQQQTSPGPQELVQAAAQRQRPPQAQPRRPAAPSNFRKPGE